MSYPPRYSQPGRTGPASIKMPAARFRVVPNLRGFEVMDNDGRTVDELPTESGANEVADVLNEAAAAGSDRLSLILTNLVHNHATGLIYYDGSED